MHNGRGHESEAKTGEAMGSIQVLGSFLIFLSLSGAPIIRALPKVKYCRFSSKMDPELYSLGQNKLNELRSGKK